MQTLRSIRDSDSGALLDGLFVLLFFERFHDGGRDELGHVAVPPVRISHHRRADERIFLGRHQKDGFDFGAELAVGKRHPELGVEVADLSEPAHQGRRPRLAGPVDDEALVTRGIRLQVLGIVLAIASAAAFALFVRTTSLVPPGLDPRTIGQVRLSPDFLSLVVALGAGVAGAASLTTGVSSALVGVMIAVALIPPAATVGIGLAFGLPSVALSSGVLVLVNVLSINLAALLVFWYSGYAPPHFFRREEARSQTIKRVGVLLGAILVLSVFLGAVTYTSVTEAAAERQIQGEIDGLLDEPAYQDATPLDVTITRTGGVLFRQVETVTVTVGVPAGESVPDLAERLDERLDAALGTDVTVEIRLVETVVAN